MGKTNDLGYNLPQLQNQIKRDPVSYKDDVSTITFGFVFYQ